jgi:excisionase family DNA binding protein
MSETPSQLMIAAEVARWLRIKCSTVYGWAATRKIPSVKMNGAIRFVRSDVEHWINDRSRMPADSPIRPILPSKPTSVSRVTIQRAGDRAIRHVADRQQLQRNLRSEAPFPTEHAEERKGRA